MTSFVDQLPFHSVNDNDFARLFFDDSYLSLNKLNSMTVETFIYNNDINTRQYDPDNFYLNSDGFRNPSCDYLFPDNIPDAYVQSNPNNFNVFFCNINSIPYKLSDLLDDNIIPLAFDAITFCETKLNSNIQHLYSIPGYNLHTNNNSRHSGGVAIYIRENADCFIRNDLTFMDSYIETLFIEIKSLPNNIIIGVVYRRPKTDAIAFINKLDDILIKVACENKSTIITGDFNFNLLKLDSIATVQEYLMNFQSKCFFNLINKPTRVTPTSATCLDHIWCNNLKALQSCGIIYSRISDHFPVVSSFDLTCSKNTNSKITKLIRKFNDTNTEKFTESLRNTSWDLVLSSINPNVILENFYSIFNALFNKHFPLEPVKHTKSNDNKPYITNEIKSLIKEKHKLQRKYAKYPVTYGEQFRQLRNRVTQKIRVAEANYYKSLLDNNKGNSKKTWQAINTILRRNKTNKSPETLNTDIGSLTASKDIANHFNKFFTEIGPRLSENVPSSLHNFSHYLGEAKQNEFILSPVTEAELLCTINLLNDSAAGFDEIPSSLIKKTASILSPVLLHLCNCSFASGIFPNLLKTAKVTPVFKSGDNCLADNFRPISVLCTLNRILESLMKDRLSKFCQNNNLIAEQQYGFQPNKSTESAVTTLTDHILTQMDNNKFTIGIFLDFSKAFDTVDHQILLRKLENCGIKGTSLAWFQSYLNNRKQFVHLNNEFSEWLQIKCGVPQGSILGPILFLLYINDIINSSKLLKFVLFADDSTLYASHSDLNYLISSVNQEITYVKQWIDANKLTLNVKKTHYIIFARLRKKISIEPIIKINNDTLNRVYDTKFLGVTLDSHLSW